MRIPSLRAPAARATLVLGALALPLALAACSNDEEAPRREPASIEAIGGNGQDGTIGTALQSPLEVRVLDADGKPVEGATITWDVTAGGGTVRHARTVSNPDGTSSNDWTLGEQKGTETVAARVGALAAQTVTFMASAYDPDLGPTPPESTPAYPTPQP